MATKRDFEAHAEQHGIEIEDEPGYTNRQTGEKAPRHIHAYAPNGYVFEGSDTHNRALWDDVGYPKWSDLIADMTLKQCPYNDCEHCE